MRAGAPITLAVAALLAAAGCGGSSVADRPPALRVLFVGNSLTAANDLPAAVARLAERAGGGPIAVEAVAPGGVSLEEHWRETGARASLARAGWDAVVLQQGPSSLPASRSHLRRWARRWADAVRAAGARPALLQVWPETQRAAAFPAVLASYAGAARASGALLLPAGAAWREALRRDPELGLYGPDGFHPSERGTLLAALVVHAGLTGRQPAPPAGEEPAAARVLASAAAAALAGS
ncbi:MAG TPA: SGNH/GDSL hydrolase family protein [Gaiellaceae bacterium]|nr:SGNH/GDSL hydrolase family protein [Gaiellaceae bacterium]